MTDLKCMYCAESGITNTDVFIEIVDVELGAGWICKECFLESEKEKDEHLKELEQELKRKEQECETLASQLDFEVQKKECLEQKCKKKSWEIGNLGYKIKNQRKEINIRLEQLDQLKAENKKLKRQHQGDKGLITTGGKLNYQLLQEYDKLKQTLTEIEEIAEHCIKQDICTTCNYSEKCHIEDEEIPTYDVCKLILQKISEVEDG